MNVSYLNVYELINNYLEVLCIIILFTVNLECYTQLYLLPICLQFINIIKQNRSKVSFLCGIDKTFNYKVLFKHVN